MPLPFIDEDTAALLSANMVRRSVFFRLESDPALHHWSGFGDILAPMRDVSVGDEAYYGGGQFQGLPELAELINGLADRVEFSISGLDSRASALVADDAPSVRNVPLHIGWAVFDQDWQLATDIVPLSLCTADFVAMRQDTPGSSETPPTCTVILSCHYGEPDRFRGKLSHWTPPHQDHVEPDDTSCDFVYLFQTNYQVPWPRG